MIQSIGEIIKDTNAIADGIYHNAQRYGKSTMPPERKVE